MFNINTLLLLLFACTAEANMYIGGNGGQFITCPAGYYGHGLCGSGSTPSCSTHDAANTKYEVEFTCLTALEIKNKSSPLVSSDGPTTWTVKTTLTLPAPCIKL
jgi:hypothetical protein